jgi:2-C-methyl-D-erythritol 4-phosphate cytidylyltransferase
VGEDLIAVILAAGEGSRVAHHEPKQFIDLNGLPLIARTVANLDWCSRIVVVVHHPDHLDRTQRLLTQAGSPASVTFVPGGSTRRLSISAALAALSDLPDDIPLVLQNAASPNTPPRLVVECVAALETHEMAQAFVPAVDTVIRHQDGELSEVLQRGSLGYSVDPTVFRLGCLRRIVAFQAASRHQGEMTMDTAREMGVAIRVVASPESNVKLTTLNDLLLLQNLVAAYEPPGSAGR